MSTYLPAAFVDHGLDGEHHAGLAHAGGLVVLVVRHVGRAVKQVADAVAAVGAHDGQALGLDDVGDDVAELADRLAGLDRGDGRHQGVVGRLDELLAGVVNFADRVRLVQVAVVA
mgnify:CR=1 FL=1